MENKKQLVTSEQEEKLRKLGFDWCEETPTVALALKWFEETRKLRYKISITQLDLDYKPGIMHESDELKTYYYGSILEDSFSYPHNTISYDTTEEVKNELLHFSIILFG